MGEPSVEGLQRQVAELQEQLEEARAQAAAKEINLEVASQVRILESCQFCDKYPRFQSLLFIFSFGCSA